MTLRDLSVRNVLRNGDRKNSRRLRDKRRRLERRLLSESLEQRQLLAGPELAGILSSTGDLLGDGVVLSVSPRELVFQFDDETNLDIKTVKNAIQITQAGAGGAFDSATAVSDLGTNSQLTAEFRAVETGSSGNGIRVDFTSNPFASTQTPLVSVDGRVISIEVSSNPAAETTMQDVISAVANEQTASTLLEVIPVTGSTLTPFGQDIGDGLSITLEGANSAQAVTDFGTNGAVQIRLVAQVPGTEGTGITFELEKRNFGGAASPVVVVSGNSIRVQLNSTLGSETTAEEFLNAINLDPAASALVSASFQEGDVQTRIGASASLPETLILSGVSEASVEAGYVGFGDSSREVIFRFAKPLEDALYQIDITGSGPTALRNLAGELFQDGSDLTQQFSVNLGPQVVAVVPEPVARTADGLLVPQIGKIDVYFNDDSIDPNGVVDPSYYALIFTQDTVGNTDDVLIMPESITFNSVGNVATLDFGSPLARIDNPLPGATGFLTGAARLRIGADIDADPGSTIETPYTAPLEVALDPQSQEPGDHFTAAFDVSSVLPTGVDAVTGTSVRLSSEIFNPSPYGLDLPGPDMEGVREIREEDPSRLLREVPLDYVRGEADAIDGISVMQYDFASSWLGDDPGKLGIAEDRIYNSVISEQQKDRVREVISQFSEYLGISFIEVDGAPTSDAFMSIAVGDLYGADENTVSENGGSAIALRDRNGDGVDDLAVLDFQDFDESDDDSFGGEFYRGAMFAVGQLLGYGYADGLPAPVSQSSSFIFSPDTSNEAAFPTVADIIHGQYLFRPDSIDIDLYQFDVPASGSLSVETVAQRLENPSLLDPVLKIYRLGSDGSYEPLAFNDDYFSNDSFVDLEVNAGTYMIGVSARGNSSYEPAVPGTGFGGLSEGVYELQIDFRPNSATGLTDRTGVALDGDGDGRPGGLHNFWFVPGDIGSTLYVDKAATASVGTLGEVTNPFTEIDQALSSAMPGDTVRVLGNGGVDGLAETLEDNYSYQIGFNSNGTPLADGTGLDLPQGVRMVVDSGAILKMSRSRIGVGSTSLIDGSDSALQILGTPNIIMSTGLPARDEGNAIIPGSVFITSINDNSVGNGNTTGTAPMAGDWGGIDFRGDIDRDYESRRNREIEGVFLNHIQQADIRFGGGQVLIGGQPVVVSPIDMAVTRPTIAYSTVSGSADAALAATPDTFAETHFTDPFYQAGAPFTPDYDRVGPDLRGNTIVDNTMNGLHVRVRTRAGNTLETLTKPARFDDEDITIILTETLKIEGAVGGPVLDSTAPNSLLVRGSQVVDGNVPSDKTYVYRITYVDGNGLESDASLPTTPVSPVGTDPVGIRLEQLPAVNSETDFTGRRLYRAEVKPGGVVDEYRLVLELNAIDTFAVDRAETGTDLLSAQASQLRSRQAAGLIIDPGTVVKVDGARIEARFGANIVAEGRLGLPVVITSLEDQRYGAGGTFNTNERPDDAALRPGDWGGLYVGQGASAQIDHAVIAGAGGTTRIEGGFASFNPIEVHQADLRLANTRLEFNADGRGEVNGNRVGRGDNSDGAVFVRASQPVIVNNEFLENQSAAISIDVNSFSAKEVFDSGPTRSAIDQPAIIGNAGPLIQGNELQDNLTNGVVVRGGQVVTEVVLDDTDIVHVVRDSIEVPNRHVYGGLRLESDARSSLVVKFESAENENAGLVIGGTLLSGDQEFRDIADRIGGSLQVVGHPDFPVVLTTLADDTVGAGFTVDGRAQRDTNGDGIAFDDLASGGIGGLPVLPTGPEVDRGLTIDNDVDINLPGYFEGTIADGGDVGIGASGVTVEDLSSSEILIAQDYIFAYHTFVTTAAGVEQLSATTITQPATLIADDVVESKGTFAGPNGLVSWTATTSFEDGVSRLTSVLDLDSGQTTLGDIQVVSYLDEDVDLNNDDILVTSGIPGAEGFRVFTIDSVRRVGFSHGGHYIQDGVNLVNASYTGWAADQFNELQTAIAAGTQTFSIAGDIDLTDLPASADPVFGQQFGPNDVTTGFAWNTDAIATTARITNFLELLSRDPAVAAPLFDFEAGLWDGVVVREGADDRNVAAFTESEPVRSGFIDTNAIPGQSEFLGEIAPDLKSGDENRRLGFIINGSVARRDDLDVYSFVAESGTEVFLDIDMTGHQLDSVVELINANGLVLASSNDSILAETDEAAIYTDASLDPNAAKPLSVASQPLAVQQISIDHSIVSAAGGELVFTISGLVEPVRVLVSDFQLDPALSIQAALTEAYDDDFGTLESRLLTRGDLEDFVVQLTYDDQVVRPETLPQMSVVITDEIGASIAASVSEVLLPSQLQDDYSVNKKDAGFRVRLPGEEDARNLYHVRVRSSNTADPADFFNTIGDASLVRDGLTVGGYQLQIRLHEGNERAGTQIRLADVRFATTGLQIIGQPLHSPLLGEEHETSASNDSLAEAQPLGLHNVTGDQTAPNGILQSDRLAKSVSGAIDSRTDVDWYRFDVNYTNLTRDAAALYLATVFDLDYAGGLARANMAMYVFNAQGELVLMGTDSNIADDRPVSDEDNNTDDLSRGSISAEDPFIGAAELSEGTYFVAVSNQQQVPQPLDQFFNEASNTPLLRVEPIDSVKRIAEDRIGTVGGGTGSETESALLFDEASILEQSFDDTLIYVNTATEILMVNPSTGVQYGVVGGLSSQIDDVAFRANGELFGYTANGGTDDSVLYVRIDTGTGALTTVGSAAIETRHQGTDPAEPNLTEVSNEGFQVNAISIRDFQGAETGFAIGERPTPAQLGLDYIENVLFQFDDATGEFLGQAGDIPVSDAGAGISPREIGQIDTVSSSAQFRQLGLTDATEVGIDGRLTPSLFDGDSFTISNNTDFVTFEFEQGNTLNANGNEPVRDGDLIRISSSEIGGEKVFEIETSQRIQLSDVAPFGDLSEGTVVEVEGSGGIISFEFVRLGDPAEGNVGIPLVDAQGQILTASEIATAFAAEINGNVDDVVAVDVGNEVHFEEPAISLEIQGLGLTVLGSAGLTDASHIAVPVNSSIGPENLMALLAETIRAEGIAVSQRGTQLSLPRALSLNVQPDPLFSPSAFSIIGSQGHNPNSTAIALYPTDTAEVIAVRIQEAVQQASDAGDLPGVSVATEARSVGIVGGFLVNVTGNLQRGGLPRGGTITGVEIVNDQLFAISDEGGLYVVTAAELEVSTGNEQLGSYVVTATDLIEVEFAGLRAGPMSVADGAYSDMLFGITSAGDIHAFDTLGELQPVFSGGRSVIATGVPGALGFDFATLDYNLWHTSELRAGDDGHGIDALPNGTRDRVDGGASLAFTYENAAFVGNYSSPAEQPVSEPRTDASPVANTYNFPGGAKGVVESQTFSLEGVSADDKPTLYYNYFAGNDGNADRLRVYVIAADGTQYLVSSNSEARGAGLDDDEFDDPAQVGSYNDDIDVSVQQTFDNTGSWRQARIDLGDFAGQANLQLRLEFATAGTTLSSSESLRIASGQTLASTAIQPFTVGSSLLSVDNEAFVPQLAPTVSVPSGAEIKDFYENTPAENVVLTIDGQEYLLDDGSRVASGQEVVVDLTANASLEQLSAADVAMVLAEAINTALPANPTVSGVYLSDARDLGQGESENDLLFEATPLPYEGGNLTIEGSGRLGIEVSGTLIKFDDVDLLRVDVVAGTKIAVDLDLVTDNLGGLPLDSVIRFFDVEGRELTSVLNPAADTVEYSPAKDGVVYIGFSGVGNNDYDPRFEGSATSGQTGVYTASISMTQESDYRVDGHLIEFAGGQQQIDVSHPELLGLSLPVNSDANAIPLSRFMTAGEVAAEVRKAIANRFLEGDVDYLPLAGNTIRLPGLSIVDAGPFFAESERQGEAFASGIIEGAQDNVHEGIYLDDFVIGLSERGEVVTGPNNNNAAFTTDLRPAFSNPADPTSDLVTGSYALEIRDASEYVNSLESTQFRTFDSNDRMVSSTVIAAKPAAELRDGDVFRLSDGRTEVAFEFDQVGLGNGVQTGHVAIPFNLDKLDAFSGLTRAETAAETARNIVGAINRADVQAVLNVSASLSEGSGGLSGSSIDLFGRAMVDNTDLALSEVKRAELRGDENRDRGSQGVVLVENSRFLFNEEHGIVIDHGFTADVDGQTTQVVTRYPRNLVELNTENIASGVVVQSNVVAFNDLGGIKIEGAPLGSGETASDAVWFDRIVNNTIIGGDISLGRTAPPQSFNGVVFQSGTVAFADAVVDYDPNAGGIPPIAIHQVPANAIGAPDAPGIGPEPVAGTETVSLGFGGSLTLQFVDNLLTGSGNAQPDLMVFESGEIESVLVEISRDGSTFFDVGIVGGLQNSIDIDSSGFGTQDRFAFVRLTDLRQGDSQSPSAGADIDAVGALSSAYVESFNPSGVGIELTGNSAPVLLNNLIANSDVGIELDGTYDLPLVGGNSYYRNVQDVSAGADVGQFAQQLSEAEVVFFGAPTLVFAPAANASIIDSSIDSIEDRASLIAVKQPLGLQPSPVLAPDYDVNGQLRIDDPNVQTPNGLGELVFKDRGAFDRGDTTGPRVLLVTPQAPALGDGAGVAEVLGQIPEFFEIQIIDGIAPADVAPGTGINDYSVSSESVLLLKDGVAQVEGLDYRFSYLPSTNVIRLTPIAGVWEEASTYVIRMTDASDAIIRAGEGATYSDGERLYVVDSAGNSTTFEYETGLMLNVNPLLIDLGLADGITIEVFDGVTTLVLELDDDSSFDLVNTDITVPSTTEMLASSIADAINESSLNLSAIAAGNSVQLLGDNLLSNVTPSSALLSVQGAIGVSNGFGLQIPNDGVLISDTLEEGQTFSIRQGSLNNITFEFDSDNNVESNDSGVPNVAIPFTAVTTLDQLADAIAQAIAEAPLGLNPTNAGYGRVSLGGDRTYALDLSETVLTQNGFPAESASVPVTIERDSSDKENAVVIAAAIDAADMQGVTAEVVDRQVFLEGSQGVSGSGAVAIVPISDEVGNLLQSNQPNGRTELVIYVGGGYDYGDAAAPYITSMSDGGPRHVVDRKFALSPLGDEPSVTADSEPRLDNLDEDNGVSVTDTWVVGFTAPMTVFVQNEDGRDFYLDAWFDWDKSGTFDEDEVERWKSISLGGEVFNGESGQSVQQIPSDTEAGEITARFRLSEVQNLGPNGDAASGEVEDWVFVVEANPFRNLAENADVNASGAVTPIDALQLINALQRNEGNAIDLSVLPLPADLPSYPDVDGNGFLSLQDVLRVLNRLYTLYDSGAGEGEATEFVPIAGGLMASQATLLGDEMLRQESGVMPAARVNETTKISTSVFDSPAAAELDQVFDALAVDAVNARETEDANLVDALFATL